MEGSGQQLRQHILRGGPLRQYLNSGAHPSGPQQVGPERKLELKRAKLLVRLGFISGEFGIGHSSVG